MNCTKWPMQGWFELRGVLEILLLVGAFPDLHGWMASAFGFWVGLRNLPRKAIALRARQVSFWNERCTEEHIAYCTLNVSAT